MKQQLHTPTGLLGSRERYYLSARPGLKWVRPHCAEDALHSCFPQRSWWGSGGGRGRARPTVPAFGFQACSKPILSPKAAPRPALPTLLFHPLLLIGLLMGAFGEDLGREILGIIRKYLTPQPRPDANRWSSALL